MTGHGLSSVFKEYEGGKHRRYNLLFAVNGGAFAIAKLLATPPGQKQGALSIPEPLSLCECFLPWVSPSAEQTASAVLGNLSLCQLSLGMVLFTTVMTLDIFMFGGNMRRAEVEKDKKVFGWQGKLVLIIIGWLISAGWLLVSFDVGVFVLVSVGYFILFALVWFIYWCREKKRCIVESKSSEDAA
jgi:hypothetical protein